MKRYANVADATRKTDRQRPRFHSSVAPLYFAFRIMVACGILMLLIIGASFWSVIRNRIGEKNGCCAAFYGLPLRGLPWSRAGLLPNTAVSRGRLVSPADGGG